jgi:formate hydrogenlyase subunit 6/NADH:ubiquinone oxidoreductase subunit I
VLTTLKYFNDEYLAHVVDKTCPAHVCKALRSYSIDADKCRGCTACAKKCPVGAITGELKKPHTINSDKCIKCGACKDTCKFDAVVVF